MDIAAGRTWMRCRKDSSLYSKSLPPAWDICTGPVPSTRILGAETGAAGGPQSEEQKDEKAGKGHQRMYRGADAFRHFVQSWDKLTQSSVYS